MRILTVHTRYLRRGGEDVVRDAEERMLRDAGCTVDSYEDCNTRVAELGAFRSAAATTWSGDAYRRLRRMLQDGRHDIVHVHNFFPVISPSVYFAARAENVPVVQTLHNYRLMCPSAILHRDGRVCEDCVGRLVPWPSVLHGCYRDSRPASAAVSLMLATHRLLGTWRNRVDVYVALTEFARRKYIEGGLPPEKLVVKPNFVGDDPGPGTGGGGYALAIGRLVREKGIDLILEAWRRLGARIPLRIVGDGPLAPDVAAQAAAIEGVSFLGPCSLEESYRHMGEARFLVFAPRWYEGFPRILAEALAKGTPVVAARLGGAAEVVDPGLTGLHFAPGDVDDLVAKVEWLLAHPGELGAMRAAARATFLERYTAATNLRQLLAIYERAARCRGRALPELPAPPGESVPRARPEPRPRPVVQPAGD